MEILNKILKKRGLKVEELNPEEKQQFEEWRLVLSKEELTTEDIKNFCQGQIEIIENKWSDYNLDHSKKSELLPYHTVYRTLLATIESPKAAREALEKNLNQFIQ